MERRAKLLGLDAPQQVQVEGEGDFASWARRVHAALDARDAQRALDARGTEDPPEGR